MEILRDYKQISTRVQKIFGVDVSNQPILDAMTNDQIKTMLENSKVNKDLSELSTLAELIFQLNEYVPALCNFVKMLLNVKYYEGIVVFLEKLFVAHVGTCLYNSKNKEYSHKERFFDRFIEVVKSTDISLADYLPFLFAILDDNDKTVLSNYLAPCLEYMQNIFRENYAEIKEFVAQNPNYKNTYYTLGLEFNTQGALYEIFNSDSTGDAIFAKILKHYYKDTMAFFDKNLESAGDKKFHYVKILASIENPEVTARLQDLYEEETNDDIKAFIKSKLGIADRTNLGCSPKHFAVTALKKVEVPQERTLGVAFEHMPLKFVDGTEADNVCKTYLLNIFKQEKDLLNLSGLNEIKDLFNPDDLHNFAQSIFKALLKLDDIKSAKWAIRLTSLLCDDTLKEQIFEFVQTLYLNGRAKEAKYYIECLFYTKDKTVIQLIKKLQEDATEKFLQEQDYYINLFTDVNEVKPSDVQDLLVNDSLNEEVLQTQKQRLYKNFIANKSYTKEQFKDTFINKKVFNKLAEHLVFGEYKQNRLLNLFVLEGENIKYIVGSSGEQDSDIKIKVAHSLDLDDRFENAKNYFSNPTFVQFENHTFAIKDSEKTLTKMANMQGILINALKFVSNMQSFGFIKNVANESDDATEMVYVSNELNLLAEVSFESPVSNFTTTASLGNIRYYKLNQCLSSGGAYIINKANALPLGTIVPRFYNFVASSVSKSLRV